MIKLPELKIGNTKLKNCLMLAPMAGITDLPLRKLAMEGGAGLVFTEMVSATALVHKDKKTYKLLTMSDEEKNFVSAQIFGMQADIMADAAKQIQDLGFKFIDINLGCPAKKIAKVGAGAKLLANPAQIEKVLSSVVKAVTIPVTAKTRIGLIEGQIVAPEIIEISQNCGIQMVSLHARYAQFAHSGEPNMEAFEQSVENAKIPIIANGGIFDIKSAEKFLKIKKCAGLMIGRGAIGDYDIFRRIESFLNKEEMLPLPSIKSRIAWFKKHIVLSANYYGENKGLTVLRKIAPYYIKGLPNACALRNSINKITTLKEFDNLFKNIEKNYM
jgi:tRNA-dihydrouridine synthase B